MGCCTSVDLLGPPDFTCSDKDDVILARQVRYATFGPRRQVPHDVTQAVRNLYSTGHVHISGGLASAIGDPFPAQPKVFNVWYLSEKPDAEFADGADVVLSGLVAYATYGPDDAPPYDVTETVKALQRNGRNAFPQGVHTQLGDAHPGQRKVFRVWYNGPV